MTSLEKLLWWADNLDVWLSLRGFAVVRVACFAAFMAEAFIFYKFFVSRDGNFRRKLLYFWATGALRYFLLAFWYHPFYNPRLPVFASIPVWVATFWLALYIFRFYGVSGKFHSLERPASVRIQTVDTDGMEELIEEKLSKILARIEQKQAEEDWQYLTGGKRPAEEA